MNISTCRPLYMQFLAFTYYLWHNFQDCYMKMLPKHFRIHNSSQIFNFTSPFCFLFVLLFLCFSFWYHAVNIVKVWKIRLSMWSYIFCLLKVTYEDILCIALTSLLYTHMDILWEGPPFQRPQFVSNLFPPLIICLAVRVVSTQGSLGRGSGLQVYTDLHVSDWFWFCYLCTIIMGNERRLFWVGIWDCKRWFTLR